jgi:hypothetical protein
MLRIKSSIYLTGQVNSKVKTLSASGGSMTETSSFRFDRYFFKFWIWDFGHCDLFGICEL